MVLISAERWQKMRPQDFEYLCFEYFRCCYPDTEIERTPFSHDGGKDIVLSIRNPLLSSRIWVECKKHSRPIGLEELGKNIVLIVNQHVQKLIVASANEIRKSAKSQMMTFAERHNFRIKFLDAGRLECRLAEYPHLLSRFFPDLDPGGDVATHEGLQVSSVISEFEHDTSEEQVGLQLRRDTRFYIHIFLENNSDAECEVGLSFAPSESVLIRPRATGGTARLVLGPMEDRMVTFYCEALVSGGTLDLPELITSTRTRGEGDRIDRRIPMASVEVSFLRTAPLKGERNHRFLSEELPSLMEDVMDGRGRVIDLRGPSGVGKSRMLREIGVKLHRLGIELLEFDAREWDDFRLFRRLLAELIGLPLYQGFSRYTTDHLRELLAREGLDPGYADKLHPFFVTREVAGDTPFFVAEALRHFLLRRAMTVPVAIQVDNVQEMSPSLVPLWDELISCIQMTRVRVCLLLSTNTETLSQSQSESIGRLLDRLDDVRHHHPEYVRAFQVTEFTRSDARAFLMDMLPEVNRHDLLLDQLVSIAGQRPLYLEIFLHYMEDSGVIRFGAEGTWYIYSVEALAGFLNSVPPDIESALERRFMLLRDNAQEQWEAVRTTLSAILAFEGRLPLDFLQAVGVDAGTADLLVDRGFVRFDRMENSIRFYHDVLETHFSRRAELAGDRGLYRHALEWIQRLGEEARPLASRKILFHAYDALGERQNAIRAGCTALDYAFGLQNHPEVVSIGDRLMAIMEADGGPSELPSYLHAGVRYAASLVHHVHFTRGIEVFEKIREFVRFGGDDVSPEFRHRFYHEAVNARFLHLRFREALELLHEHRLIRDNEPWWQFLIEDRLAVVYTALDDLPRSRTHIEAALSIAESAAEPLWRSIAASDYGYLHFYLTGDSAAAGNWFSRAVDAHREVVDPPVYRRVEAAQQSGIVAFLNGQWLEVVERADEALWICRRAHYVLMKLRVLNLKSAALICLGRESEAESLLHVGRSEAELFFNERERWRILSNLATIHVLRGELAKGRTYLDAGLAAMRRLGVGPEGVVKELPLVGNALHVRRSLGDARGVDQLLRDYPVPRLRRYAEQFRSSRRPNCVAPTSSPDGVSLVSHRGMSLFIT